MLFFARRFGLQSIEASMHRHMSPRRELFDRSDLSASPRRSNLPPPQRSRMVQPQPGPWVPVRAPGPNLTPSRYCRAATKSHCCASSSPPLHSLSPARASRGDSFSPACAARGAAERHRSSTPDRRLQPASRTPVTAPSAAAAPFLQCRPAVERNHRGATKPMLQSARRLVA